MMNFFHDVTEQYELVESKLGALNRTVRLTQKYNLEIAAV